MIVNVVKMISQGTAVMHNTVAGLPKALQNKIAGGVLFGDTRNVQDGHKVPNFPKERIQIYCYSSDGVCGGSLNVTNGHFVYATNGDGDKAIAFLKKQIDTARGSKF
jgi:cutinase